VNHTSKQVAEQVRDSRAMLDFIVNILALAIAILGIYTAAAWRAHALPTKVVPLGAALSVVLAWSYLPAAALQWGETVKSVFDVQRRRLARDLDLELPPDPAKEAKMWRDASRMTIYRSSEAFTSLGKYRRKKRRGRRTAENDGMPADRPDKRIAADHSKTKHSKTKPSDQPRGQDLPESTGSDRKA
jgi:hypothetical protein